ncbi:uncharacterized protein LOC17882630 [Capsella rubella]|uniref:uncharacterized protein LOC17882630 n=1 Tax=Capsella rubella TaxID=81985 RepID=UPI000CD53406|nr:uncharacterized protein LOC17882630 [Capsella rubella]
MEAENQQFLRVRCRLSAHRMNHLINLMNAWSRVCLEYDDGEIVERVYRWVPGSVGVEMDGGGGDGGFDGNNQQGLGGNDQPAVQGEVGEASGSKVGEVGEASGSKKGENAVDEDHEAGNDHQSKRKRKTEHQEKKKQKIQEL